MRRREFLKFATTVAAACLAPVGVLAGPVVAPVAAAPLGIHLTLFDLVRRDERKVGRIVKVLSEQNEMLMNIPWVDDGSTGHNYPLDDDDGCDPDW